MRVTAAAIRAAFCVAATCVAFLLVLLLLLSPVKRAVSDDDVVGSGPYAVADPEGHMALDLHLNNVGDGETKGVGGDDPQR